MDIYNTFPFMLLSYFSSLCREDYISIRDGDNSSGSFIGRFCGRHLPSVTTSGRELRLTFVSGRGVSLLQHLSFRASVVAITKGIVRRPQRML